MENNTTDIPVIPITEVFVCNICKTDIKIGDEKDDPDETNKKLCENCLDKHFKECYNCGNLVHEDNQNFAFDDCYCENCYNDRYFVCEGCNNICSNDDYAENGLCNECARSDEDNDEESYLREYSKKNTHTEAGHRIFSCEIECYYKDTDNLQEVYNTINEDIGIALDGSLGSRSEEFITPKLSGKTGEKVLRDLCRKLAVNNLYVDRTCGLHIHLDTSDMQGNYKKIKQVFLFYLAFEPVLFSYLPLSRRKNTYCLPLSEFFHEKEIKECQSLERLEQLWYREQDLTKIEDRKKEKYDQSRYSGVNMHSLLANGHIEIRYHSGTIGYNKIIKWIQLHVAILDYIVKDNITESILSDIKYLPTLKEKQDKLFNLLNLLNNIRNYFIEKQKKFSNNQKNICVD